MPRILWADDEIELLKPHVLFLEEKGYDVETVASGADAVDRVRGDHFDVVFLDEQMPGVGGLEALEAMKADRPEVPVVMITKSEEEHIMEDAIGRQIADYLIKPVNPRQILSTIKRLLEGGRMREETAQQDYLHSFGEISTRLGGDLSITEWLDIYQRLTRYDLELEGAEEGVRQILDDQVREANTAFARFVEGAYPGWIAGVRDSEDPDWENGRPMLTHEVIPRHVFPLLGKRGEAPEHPVVLLVIDCMRYDQWLLFEESLRPLFEIERDWQVSILPTATPFSRNALFAGLLPIDIAKRFPNKWTLDDKQDEESLNAHEKEFLLDLFQRTHRGEARVRYEKLVSQRNGTDFAESIADTLQFDFSAVVVNFIDILVHSRSDTAILKDLAPDVPAYRALSRTWFEHSWLLDAFRELAQHDCTVVVTTDHGAVRSLHPTRVLGDRETSTSLRFKYGRSLKAEDADAVIVDEPESYGLPKTGINGNYILARNDYYFVYPTNQHRYEKQYKDTFQHGGVTMEEVLLPVATLTPKSSA